MGKSHYQLLPEVGNQTLLRWAGGPYPSKPGRSSIGVRENDGLHTILAEMVQRQFGVIVRKLRLEIKISGPCCILQSIPRFLGFLICQRFKWTTCPFNWNSRRKHRWQP